MSLKFDSSLLDYGKHNLLIIKTKHAHTPQMQEFITNTGFKKTDQSIPDYLLPFLKIYGGFKMNEILVLYSNTKQPKDVRRITH